MDLVAIRENNFAVFMLVYGTCKQTHSNYELIKYAIKEGRLRFVIYLYNKCSQRERDKLCKIAARYGKVKCLKFLHHAGCDITRSIDVAALGGKLGCVRYLLKYVTPIRDLVESVAMTNYTHTLKELYAVRTIQISPVMSAGAIRTLLDLRAKWDIDAICAEIARGDMQSVVKVYKFRHTIACTDTLIDTAALHGRTQVIQYLYSCGYPISKMAMAYCAMNGVELLRQVHAMGGPMSDLVTSACMSSRDANALKYALNNGCNCSSSMIAYSRQYPHDPLSQIIFDYLIKNKA